MQWAASRFAPGREGIATVVRIAVASMDPWFGGMRTQAGHSPLCAGPGAGSSVSPSSASGRTDPHHPGFCRHSAAAFRVSLFERYRRQLAASSMPSLRTVEHLDPVQDIGPGLVLVGMDAPQPGFQSPQSALCRPRLARPPDPRDARAAGRHPEPACGIRDLWPRPAPANQPCAGRFKAGYAREATTRNCFPRMRQTMGNIR